MTPPPPHCSPEQQISSDESIMLTKLYCIQNNQWHVLIFLASNGPFPSPWGHNLNKIFLILQAIWLLRNGFLKHIQPYFHSLLLKDAWYVLWKNYLKNIYFVAIIEQGNEEEVENVKHLQIDRWRPGKKVIRKAHFSFQLKWAKNSCAVINHVPKNMYVEINESFKQI